MTLQFGLGRGQLRLRDFDLIAVWYRVDLRDYLTSLDMVVFVGGETDDPAGHRLRCDVNDMSFDERIVCERMAATECDPIDRRRKRKDHNPA